MDFIEYVVSEVKSKRLSKANAMELIKQFAHKPSVVAKVSAIHPLLHRNISNLITQGYQSSFSGNEFFLTDHQINKQKILPGVVYLEMARAALENAEPFRDESTMVKLSNIVWLQPFIVDEEKDIYITLLADDEKPNKRQLDFEIFSLETNEDGVENEVINCQGKAEFVSKLQIDKLDIKEIKSQLRKDELNVHDIYKTYKKLGVDLGPAHQSLKAVYRGEEQILARLALPEFVNDGSDDYVIHPSILDGALQSAIGLVVDFDTLVDRQEIALPFAMESLNVISPSKKEMYALVRYPNGKKTDNKVTKLDIDICDNDGNVCVQMQGYTSLVTNTDRSTTSKNKIDKSTLFASPVWELNPAKEATKESVKYDFSEKHIVLCGMKNISDEEIQSLFPNCQTVSLQTDGHHDISEQYTKVALACFEIIQKILIDKIENKSLVQIVIPNSDENILLGGLSGILKTASLENPQLFGQLILTDSDVTGTLLLEQLKNEESNPYNKFIKYDQANRYVQRYKETELSDDQPNIVFKDNGVYIITGGLGGLGLLFAKEIFQQTSQSKVILAGRSKLTSEKQALLDKLPVGNGLVSYKQVDFIDLDQITKVITSINKEYKQLNGIIHCAGAIADNFILKKDAEEFRKVLSPKVTGTYHLDIASKHINLDFLVLFSSGASVLGNIGQADYAAANGFLDQYANYRNKLVSANKRQGKTLSINWPLWKEGGMSVGHETQKILQSGTGMYPMQTQTGLDAFYKVLMSQHQQVMVAEGDITLLRKTLLTGQLLQSDAIKSNGQRKQQLVASIDSKDNEEKTREFLKKQVSEVLKIPLHKIDTKALLEKYGIDSILAMELTNKLEKTFGNLPKTLFFEYQTINALAEYFIKSYFDKLATLFSASNNNKPELINHEEQLKAEVKTDVGQRSIIGKRFSRSFRNKLSTYRASDSETLYNEPIAIVGLSGRYPEAVNIEEYWQNLRSGKDCIREVPISRWNWRDYYTEDRNKKGHHYSKWGGFISGVDEFDPRFFNISPREAQIIDPQERLFLQHAWMAVEDAGYNRDSLYKSRNIDQDGQVGVYVGVMYSEYQLFGMEASMKARRISIPGSYASIANRVSYVLNLHGPSMTLDTMCSSSITAIHLACQDLKLGRTNIAIAGGVNVSIHPNKYLFLSSGQFISTNGHCQSFGEGGDGYIPGEGVGVVILKRLSEAIKDGNHIYGVIKGSTLNHGGKTNGYSVPNPNAQTSVINRAITESKINPRHISFIEAHGTGTKLGDPIEIAALSNAFRKHTQDTGFCLIGSAKSNIGHCESAAGIAGLTKVLLQMNNQQIVPSLHSTVLNPYIDFENTPFVVNQTLRKWEQPVIDGQVIPRIAGISSFGAGGSNAHLIVQEYTPPVEVSKPVYVNADNDMIIPLSARTPEQLKQKARDLVEFIRNAKHKEQSKENSSPAGKSIDLISIAYTLQLGREAMEERVGFIVSTIDHLIEKLQSYIDEQQDIEYIFQGQTNGSKSLLNTISSDEDFEEAINKWISSRKLSKVLELWVNGMELNWNKFYSDVKPSRISLPTYPFAKERYWISSTPDGMLAKEENTAAVIHPLLHTNTSDFSQQSYTSTFNGKEFFFTDHKIDLGDGLTQKLLPASAFLEMARVAVEKSSPNNQELEILVLHNIALGQPAVFKENKQINIALYANEANQFDYEIYSKEYGREVVYCLGQAVYSVRPAPVRINLENLNGQMKQGKFDSDRLYSNFSIMGFHYGPAYQGIISVSMGVNQLLARLCLPAVVEKSKNDYILHPSIMDSAIQASICLVADLNTNQGYPFLPFALESLLVITSCTKEMYAWVRHSESFQAENKLIKLDVDLCDQQGNICVQMKGLSLQQIALGATSQADNELTLPVKVIRATDSVSSKSQAIQLVGANEINVVELSTDVAIPQAISLIDSQKLNIADKNIIVAKPSTIKLGNLEEAKVFGNNTITNPQEIGLSNSQQLNTFTSGTHYNESVSAADELLEPVTHLQKQKSIYTKEQIQQALIKSLAEALFLNPTEVSVNKPFIDLGMDSIVGVEWVKAINKEFELDISSTRIYDYSTIKDLANFLIKELGNTQVSPGKELQFQL